MVNFGVKSRTDGALVYLRGAVSPELLEEVRRRLSQVKIDVVLESGYLQPFLDAKPLSIFSGVGYTSVPRYRKGGSACWSMAPPMRWSFHTSLTSISRASTTMPTAPILPPLSAG